MSQLQQAYQAFYRNLKMQAKAERLRRSARRNVADRVALRQQEQARRTEKRHQSRLAKTAHRSLLKAKQAAPQ